MVNAADPADPMATREEMQSVDHDDAYRPDGFYGVSKMAGEGLGSYYADRTEVEVVNLRIGWLLSEDDLRQKQSLPPEQARHARTLWLSPRDCRHGFRRAVTASLPENPLTVNLISENTDRYFSITHAMRSLGYDPRDDSAAVVD
jgi:L-arabinose 1-dehydrogenase [NAD(P)+]